ncbi:hypothetical protein PVK06_035318 [Gossypium arboreum]|uniref:Uncharacterized protein n=1 Tax=Gossypium arboreum TaxID=29729 RepID=A0ABR0NGI2_GOSAR|nr:hypothetical protein PVK06_035318 [Gossypium arboreum]
MARNENDPGLNGNPIGWDVNPPIDQPIETNPANEENAPKAPKEEQDKTESVSIEANREDKKEANSLIAPPMDSTTDVPCHSTKYMTKQDY